MVTCVWCSINASRTWVSTSQGLGSFLLLFYWSGFLCPWPVPLPRVCQWLEYFIVSGKPRALAFYLHGFLLLFCSFFWTLTIQKTSSSSVIFFFCLIWSVTEANIFFSLLRIVHLVRWLLVCGSLLVTFSWWCVLGVLVLGLTHSMESVALSYHNLQGCSSLYFFLTWSQEDCRAKIRKPICLLYFFCKSILWDRVLLYGILQHHVDDENF